jgi:hypothetical protein
MQTVDNIAKLYSCITKESEKKLPSLKAQHYKFVLRSNHDIIYYKLPIENISLLYGAIKRLNNG